MARVGHKAHNALPWTDEIDNYLLNNQDKPVRELASIITEKWFKVAAGTVGKRYRKLGVVKPRSDKGRCKKFTQTEAEWIRENYSHYINRDLTKMFAEKFGREIPATSIADFAKLYKLQFKDKELLDTRRFSVTNTRKAHPLGTEIVLNDYIWVKYADHKFHGNEAKKMSNFRKNWIEKHKLVYTQLHGEIPKDYIVVFLDGDKRNFSADNLYALPRQLHAPVCGYYQTHNADLTLAAIKLYELRAVLSKE